MPFLDVLRPIWATKTETASRVRQRIEAVSDYATAIKARSGDNPARWKGHLDHLLPRPSKVRAVKHHAALDWRQALTSAAGTASSRDTSSRSSPRSSRSTAVGWAALKGQQG